jgi:hypothetical protein
MKRVAVLLGFLAVVALLPASAAGQGRPRPPVGGGPSTTDNRPEIQQLRQQLEQLHEELREHELLLREAMRARDRRAADLQHREIRRINSEIDRLARRLHDALRGR